MTVTETGPTHATTTADGSRTYRHPTTGAVVPSVTSILRHVGSNEGLIQWAANCAAEWAIANRDLLGADDAYDSCRTAHRRQRNEAGARGTDVHSIAEKIIRGEPVSDWDRTVHGGYVDALESWHAEHKPRPLHIEATCWNTTVGYAGTADLICRLGRDKHATVIDWKTSKQFAAGMAAQLAAYRNAPELTEAGSSTPIEAPIVKRGVVVKLAADGTWQHREVDLNAGWRLFRAALTVHELHNIAATYPDKATKGGADPAQLAACVAKLRSRTIHIRDHAPEAFFDLGLLWPAAVPKFSAGGPTSLAQCATVDAVISQIELEHEVPF